MKENKYALKILSEDDHTAVYGGYGVVFGDQDIEGDTFTKETDFMLDLVPVKPVFIDHSQPTFLEFEGKRFVLKSIDESVGDVIEVSPDETGLYMKLQFEKSNQYWGIVEQLLNSQKTGLSSGSVPHLVRRDGGNIKQWPIFEESLTLTPAEPRTAKIGVERIKKLSEDNPNLKALIPEGDGTSPENSADEDSQSIDININLNIDGGGGEPTDASQEVIKMEKEKEVVEETTEPTPDVGEVVTEAVKKAVEPLNQRIEELEKQPAAPVTKAVAVNTSGLGDTETKAIVSWVKTGDGGTYDAASGIHLKGGRLTIKASNDTNMNVGTAADDGNAVPTGHFNGIIARRDEIALHPRLAVRNIPGVGTTVNVPTDNEADGEFIATSEQNDAASNNFDRDAPALSQVAMTLAKYTKKIQLTDELMQDEESRLMAFIEDFVGRGLAKTQNDLLVTEVETNGSNLTTFASATAIADGEIEDIESGDDLGAYLDDSGSVAFVMRNSTLAAIRKISGSDRVYATEATGGPGVVAARQLIGYPVFRSNKVDAIASTAKSILFGNWFYVGFREEPSITLLRDPYTVDGVLQLKYYFRTTFDVLQSEAIGYADQAA